MSFFRKKSCNCKGSSSSEALKEGGVNSMEKGIKILGSGCSKCKKLEENTKKAMAELGLVEEIVHITDFAQIATYGVMSTPALVKDGRVLSYGKVLSKEEVKDLLTKEV